jgi:hypothetical protein
MPSLFAFGIAHLPMLAWLLAAAVPILIHLWSRRQYNETPWAAMEYLLAAAKRQRRRLRIEQWLLLTIRTLLIVLVVLAVAEPFDQRAGFALPAQGNTHRLLVLDGSYSMAYRPNDKTRFDRAKELARQIVEESPQGDAFTLVLMSSPSRAVVASPTLERREIIREIEALAWTQTSADLPNAIETIREVIDGAQHENSRLTRHEVYLLTDLQRQTWSPKLSKTAAKAFLEQAQELTKTATLYLIDLSRSEDENMAVTALRSEDWPFIVGRPVRLEADLKNFGHQAKKRQPVELLVDGRRIERQEVDIDPGGTASVGFSYRFDAPVDQTIEVRAVGDALDIDNHRYLAVPVRKSIRVLCIEGRTAVRPFDGAAGYLAVALNPLGREADHPGIQAEVVPDSALVDRNLKEYDCVFLCNVAQFTSGEARVLDAYLQSGGSLVFFLGDRIMADRYNRELAGTGQGRAGGPPILPVPIGPLVDRPQFRLDPLEYRHPIVQSFRGRGETSLLTTPVFKHYKLIVPNDSPAKTVLALADGDPLMVESPIRHGRVVLVATSAEPSWSGLPLWPSFVPLVQEIVAYCFRERFQQRNLTVGEPFDISAAASTSESPPSVRTPDGNRHPIQLHTVDGDSMLHYTDTSQSGFYTTLLGPPTAQNKIFAVNVDTQESDLTRLDPQELRDKVWPGVPFIHQTSWQDLGATNPANSIRRSDHLPILFLYVVLGLLLIELLIAWKIGRPGKQNAHNSIEFQSLAPNP